jgi:hypothetical protein
MLKNANLTQRRQSAKRRFFFAALALRLGAFASDAFAFNSSHLCSTQALVKSQIGNRQSKIGN